MVAALHCPATAAALLACVLSARQHPQSVISTSGLATWAAAFCWLVTGFLSPTVQGLLTQMQAQFAEVRA
jgi:hypothetical protein